VVTAGESEVCLAASAGDISGDVFAALDKSQYRLARLWTDRSLCRR